MMYDGLALGGPLDGKRITHESPYYKAAEQNQVMPSFVSFEQTISMSDMTYDIFRYVHFKTPGGNVWIPEEVERGKRYDHKIWDHPMDYVFQKLIKSYRPEGY